MTATLPQLLTNALAMNQPRDHRGGGIRPAGTMPLPVVEKSLDSFAFIGLSRCRDHGEHCRAAMRRL